MTSAVALAKLAKLTLIAGVAWLPNHALTPGAIRGLSQGQICSIKWGKDARKVSEGLKQAVFAAYGFPRGNKDPRCPCEIDHLVSRELGGADAKGNLWPEQYFGPWNAHLKDRLENRLHKEICQGARSLADAQRSIAGDWTQEYIRYFGQPKGQR